MGVIEKRLNGFVSTLRCKGARFTCFFMVRSGQVLVCFERVVMKNRIVNATNRFLGYEVVFCCVYSDIFHLRFLRQTLIFPGVR